MDLVRQLRDVRFEMAVRGYDCAAVDAFLAKFRADVTALEQSHADAVAQVKELEARPMHEASETEGTLRRTLVLAQRLADETEADAVAAAEEMRESADAEAKEIRRHAEAEAESKRQTAEAELNAARDESSSIRGTADREVALARAEAKATVKEMLAGGERAGMARVAELEEAGQLEMTSAREPIRAEIQELEEVRSALLVDIAKLEGHLDEQRVRVKTAVEALRVGMSGSIHDLERVASDEETFSIESAPPVGSMTAADVALAPDVAITDATVEKAAPAPTVEDVETRAEAVVAEEMALSAQDEDITLEDTALEDDALEDAELEVIEPIDERAVEDLEGTELEDTALEEAALGDDALDDIEEIAALEDAELDDTAVEEIEEISEVETAEPDQGPDTVPFAVVDDAPEEWLDPGSDAADAQDDDAGSGGLTEAAAYAALSGAAVAGTAAATGMGDDSEPEIIEAEIISEGADLDPAMDMSGSSAPGMATAADLEEAELVVLDDEPQALFDTDLGADADVLADEDAQDLVVEDGETESGESFVGRFAELLDTKPIGSN